MIRLSLWFPFAFGLVALVSAGLVSQPAWSQSYRLPIGKPGARSLIVKARVLDVGPELAAELAAATDRARFERLSELSEALDERANANAATPSTDVPLGIEHVASIDRGTTFDQQLPLMLPDGELAITVLQERPRRELRVEIVQTDNLGEVVRRVTEARRELSVRPTRAIRAEPLDASNRWLLLEIRLP